MGRSQKEYSFTVKEWTIRSKLQHNDKYNCCSKVKEHVKEELSLRTPLKRPIADKPKLRPGQSMNSLRAWKTILLDSGSSLQRK